MFAFVGRARLNVPAVAVRGAARYKRVKSPPSASPAATPVAPVARRKKRDDLLAEALTKPSRRLPVAGAQLKDEELVAQAEVSEKGTRHSAFPDECDL